jgi:hypothetical protein
MKELSREENCLEKLMDDYARDYARIETITLQKEIERLKGLIEQQFKYGRPFYTNEEWQQFKTENNL